LAQKYSREAKNLLADETSEKIAENVIIDLIMVGAL
jgi:hypothetical protein